MNKIVPIFFLLFFLACNNHEIELQKQASPPKTVEAKGYIVPKDSMAEPKVILIDEGKLKRIPAGKPKVVPTNLNVHPIPEKLTVIQVDERKLRRIISGTDTFSLPKIVPAIDSPFVAKQPKPIPALPFRMKDAATCNIQYLDVDQGMNSSYVWSILEDKSGNLWFGTNGGGVSKYDGKTFTHYTEKEGLSNNSVISILEDKSGNLWFGTNGGGVSKYDGKTFTHYTKKEGLSNNYVMSILEDKSVPTGVGIWLGTDKGLNCFVVEPVLSLSKGGGGLSTTKLNENKEIINPKILVFHKEDGLKAEDFFQNSVLLDSKNHIWWGSGKALTMLDLNEFSFNEKEPQIQLDNIYLQENFVDYRHLNDTVVDSSFVNENSELKNIRFSGVANFHNYPEDLELPYYLNHLTFHFSAIDRYAPHKIKYQYKLEGLDDDWSNLTAENKADYRNIPYGNYTFKVKAIGSAGKWSKTFEYNFTIHPPWWLTWWAYTLYGVFTIVLVVVIVRWNGKKLRARAEELKVKVDEATQEIKEQKAVVEEQKAVVEEQKKHIEERHKEITDSINYAERIQRSLLASKKLLDENLNEYFIFFKPKDVVSGDFYWAT
ncbi:MAG: hypothetical protein IT232_06180, partial [Flavobacteriales bacterium]|nr:hypothetical protein [Flavobacteriales bacterium]